MVKPVEIYLDDNQSKKNISKLNLIRLLFIILYFCLISKSGYSLKKISKQKDEPIVLQNDCVLFPFPSKLLVISLNVIDLKLSNKKKTINYNLIICLKLKNRLKFTKRRIQETVF